MAFYHGAGDPLAARMEALGLREEDLQEQFVRSSGAGGQHVNKVSTCVRLTHLPTGRSVRCSQERSLSSNRRHARAALCALFEKALENERTTEANQAFHQRVEHKKRNPSPRQKRIRREAKQQRSQRKRLRKPPRRDD